jgi:hypothetical protein
MSYATTEVANVTADPDTRAGELYARAASSCPPRDLAAIMQLRLPAVGSSSSAW